MLIGMCMLKSPCMFCFKKLFVFHVSVNGFMFF